ncbi:MAG: family 20 glycosylhydrolase [Anaerolineae bacterium]|nr:family 20 glycosylhydrolase [Anaerolineae bacterium]
MALIFPEPQRVETLPAILTLAKGDSLNCHIVLADGADPLERLAADIIAGAVEAAAGQRPSVGPTPGTGIPISVGAAASGPALSRVLDATADNPEAYALVADADSIALRGRGPAGTFYAAQTLVQILRQQEGDLTVEGVRIGDWPDYKYRGLYVESKWGPDLMTLDDWKELVDYMAALKMNAFGVGVYCCWCVQYEGKRTEFLMLPFPDHPELQTPKTIRYYSARDQEWKAITYLPLMFQEDFFGDLVAYAKSRNITVRPHFNGPGHTTLIPHTHPELSSKDEAGRPTGYGYCLSNPKTYEFLFELWDSIIDRYLAPNGVDWFHMGLDEIYPVTGTDEQDPERVVDPWCKCPECRERSQEELLTEYVLKTTRHLLDKGINHITLWNDHLSRSGALTPEFVDKLAQAGVKDHIILQWWRYDEPVLEIPGEVDLRAWTTPMPGYYFWLFTQSYTSNIYPHLALGHRAGAEGADAYCVFDAAFDRNYVCLAEYAWNQTTSGDLYQFKSKYARKVMGTTGFDAVEPFEKWDQVYDSMPLVPGVLDNLLYYWHTYSAARNEYPRNVLRQLRGWDRRLMSTITRSRTHLRRAHALFSQRRNNAPDPELIDEYLFECERLIAVVDLYEALLQSTDLARAALAGTSADGRAGALAEAREKLLRALHGFDAMLAFGEEVKRPYLLPQLLRDLSHLRAYVTEVLASLEGAIASEVAERRLGEVLAEIS